MLTWTKRKQVDQMDGKTAYWVADLGNIRFLIDNLSILMVQEKGKTCWHTKRSVSCKDVDSAKEKAETILENMLKVYGGTK